MISELNFKNKFKNKSWYRHRRINKSKNRKIKHPQFQCNNLKAQPKIDHTILILMKIFLPL